MSDAAASGLPIPLEQIPQEIRRFEDPASPPRLRMMAARSLVPLGPGHLVTALFLLCYDQDGQVAQAAQESLAQIPDVVLRPALGENLPAAVLDYLARALAGSAEYLEILVLNKAVPDETIAWLAQQVDAALLEIIANNQERLLRAPGIIEALYFNSRTPQSTVDRVIDFAVRSRLDLSGIPVFREAAAALGYTHLDDGPAATAVSAHVAEPVVPLPGYTPALGATPREEDDYFSRVLGESTEVAEQEEGLGLDYDLGIEGLEGYSPKEEAERAQKSESASARATQIYHMRASQKIRLALLGSAMDRAILVRDPQRIIALAAIKSPKVNSQEVEHYATNAAVHVDVIRYIANRREWTKSYRIKLSLVQNPKTPPGPALAFLKFLRRSDLKSLSQNRNIPEVVASTARNMLKSQLQEKKERGERTGED